MMPGRDLSQELYGNNGGKRDLASELYGAPAKQDKPIAKSLIDELESAVTGFPRQAGLTARYALEGMGGIADTVAAPIRALMGQPQYSSGGAIADKLGLPSPANDGENVVAAGARLGFGGMAPIAAAGRAANIIQPPVAQSVAKSMAANPGAQTIGNAAAGMSGEYAKQNNASPVTQSVAAMLGGVAAPVALGVAQNTANAAQRIGKNLMQPQSVATPQIDITIQNALNQTQSGFKIGDIPQNVLNSVRADVAQAFKINPEALDPAAIRRLIDYRLVGATPTVGSLTLNPVTITQERNLAKAGANSKDAIAQQLAMNQNTNTQRLIAGLNDLGAGQAQPSYDAANTIIGALQARNKTAQEAINAAYAAARDSQGRSLPLNPHFFTNTANDLLEQANVGSFLPPDIRNKINGIASGKIPLTVEIAEQLKTSMGNLQRNSSDGNARMALGLVRQALDDTPLFNGSLQPQFPSQMGNNAGQAAIDAFNQARAMNRSWMQTVEKTPALQAVRDGVEPDKFVQQYIIGSGGKSNVMDVAALKNQIKDMPEAMTAIRSQIVDYLKQAGTNGKADELNLFSSSGFNKALKSVGDQKLRLFFEPEEINQLKAIGRVSSYEQVQPSGSAVNNSNTAAAVGGMLDRIANSSMLSKIPVVGPMVQPAIQNMSIGIRAKSAMNPANALVNPNLLPSAAQDLANPAIVPQGLLFSPLYYGMQQDEEKKKSLLFP